MNLTTEQVAERLNCSTGWVKLACRDGRLKGATKPGRDWQIPESALKPWGGSIHRGVIHNGRPPKPKGKK